MRKIQFSMDRRGSLGIIEFNQIPFVPQRLFWIANVPFGETRGHHAHKSCEQFLVVLMGSLTAKVDFPWKSTDIHEMTAGETLHLRTLEWLVLSNFSDDCVVGVLASEPYNESEYIRSRAEFDSIVI